MNSKLVLVVENEGQTLQVIERTLSESKTPFHVCRSSVEGWNAARMNPDITELLVRMHGPGIDGCELARRIREVKSVESMPLLMIVSDAELEIAGQALEAGASDLLIDPFEPRELRMRLNLRSASTSRRIDTAHEIASSSARTATVDTGVVQTGGESRCQPISTSDLIVPRLDRQTLKFSTGHSDDVIQQWNQDEAVAKLPMDQFMVCPCCGSLPTFRMGCGSCGSAWTMTDTLIHHYACAHVANADEYSHQGQMNCPKCLQKQLVAGADFEVVDGGHTCIDCRSKLSELQLIGHCLNCQHRFPAGESAIFRLNGYRIDASHRKPIPVTQRMAERVPASDFCPR